MTYGQRNGGNGRYGRGVGHRNRNRVISETTASIAGMRVAIVRKPIKNMYLRIKPPNADIVISAPQRMSQSAIERFVTERKPWIERAQRSMRQARDAQLNAQRAQNGNIGDTGASANPPAFVWTDEAKARAQRNIESQLPVLLAKWGPIVGRTPTHITLRLMSSRWGSCTPKTGRIRLNLQLGLMAPRFLEYVLVHGDDPPVGERPRRGLSKAYERLSAAMEAVTPRHQPAGGAVKGRSGYLASAAESPAAEPSSSAVCRRTSSVSIRRPSTSVTTMS